MYPRPIIVLLLLTLVKLTYGLGQLECHNCVQNWKISDKCVEYKEHQVTQQFQNIIEHLLASANLTSKDQDDKRYQDIQRNIKQFEDEFRDVYKKGANIDLCLTTVVGHYVIRSGVDSGSKKAGVPLRDSIKCRNRTIDAKNGLKYRKCWCKTAHCNDKGIPQEQKVRPKHAEKVIPRDEEVMMPNEQPILDEGKTQQIPKLPLKDAEKVIANEGQITVNNGSEVTTNNPEKLIADDNKDVTTNGQGKVMSTVGIASLIIFYSILILV